MTKKLEILQSDDADHQVPVEVLAVDIRSIAAGIKKLRKGPLSERAILILIHDVCVTKGSAGYLKRNQYPAQKPGINDIRSVLAGIENLAKEYLVTHG